MRSLSLTDIEREQLTMILQFARDTALREATTLESWNKASYGVHILRVLATNADNLQKKARN